MIVQGASVHGVVYVKCFISEQELSPSQALLVVLHIDDVMRTDGMWQSCFCVCLPVQDGCGGECWQEQHLEESSSSRR